MSMARSTRSGTLVGPGICRKCLPVCRVIGVLPGHSLGFASRSNITIRRACPAPGGARQCIRGRALPCQAGARQARHCAMHENEPMAARRPQKSRNSAENSALAARLAREITGDVFSMPSTAAATRPTPRSTRSCRWASWCPGPWTRRCGRWRSPATTGGSSRRAAAAPRNAARPSTTGIVVDFSKHLNRIISLDVENRTCVVEPGIVLDDLNRQLKKHGLWFPVDVSTASRATIGGMAGNNSCGGRSLRYGTMRDNTLSMDAALADGTLLHFGEVPRDLAQVNSPDSGLALFRDMLASASARPREIADKIPKSAAPGRRLQSRRAGAAQCAEQHGASPGRLGRDAGLHHPGRAEALAGDPQQGAGRLPFRQLLRGDGCRPASGEAAADRGRAGRPHHDRARPRHRDVPADHRRGGARRSRRGADRRIRRGGPGRKPAAPEAARRADGRSRFWLGQAAAQMGRRGRDHRARAAERRSPTSAPPASTS